MVGLSVLVRGSVEEKLRWTFSLYDVNGDGYVTKDDLQDIVAAIHGLVAREQEHHGNQIVVKRHSEMAFNVWVQIFGGGGLDTV